MAALVAPMPAAAVYEYFVNPPPNAPTPKSAFDGVWACPTLPFFAGDELAIHAGRVAVKDHGRWEPLDGSNFGWTAEQEGDGSNQMSFDFGVNQPGVFIIKVQQTYGPYRMFIMDEDWHECGRRPDDAAKIIKSAWAARPSQP